MNRMPQLLSVSDYLYDYFWTEIYFATFRATVYAKQYCQENITLDFVIRLFHVIEAEKNRPESFYLTQLGHFYGVW